MWSGADQKQCDEAQPSCQKCRLYGVACNYSKGAGPLDLDAHGSFQVQFDSATKVETYNRYDEIIKIRMPTDTPIVVCVPPLRSFSCNTSLATLINDSLRANTPESTWLNESRHFTPNQLQLVSRFRERTSLTIGNPQMAPLYRDLVCQLACRVHPPATLILAQATH